MAGKSKADSPNYVHPEEPGAVGSRNSLNRNSRDEYQEAKTIIDEEVNKILNHIHAKLPPEVLERLDVMGSIKSKLHNYFNQDFQNMLNRYLVTMEDEMSKKVRDLIDKEENKTLNSYTPREITELLDRIGGDDSFNTEEVEKSVVNMYGYLQNHIERGVADLKTHADALLSEREEVNAFIRSENSYSIVNCSFRDNPRRPKTVMDLKLSVSILDSELISRIYHHQVPIASLIKDVVSRHIHDLIDREIEESNRSLVEEGSEELSETGKFFERFRIMDKYVSDEDAEDSKRYQFIAKRFLDAVDGLEDEIDSDDGDALDMRENIRRIIDSEDIRNRGFNTAINRITEILDTSGMGYQCIENYKNSRECIIREYEEDDGTKLPDERYSVRLAYYEQEQLMALREAYTARIDELDRDVRHLWDVCEAIYRQDRDSKGEDDWETLANRMLQPETEKKGNLFKPKEQVVVVKGRKRPWNEISFIPPQDTDVERSNPTEESRIEEIANRFPVMMERLRNLDAKSKEESRQILESRLEFIRDRFEKFLTQINPYHMQAGLLLDIDITSIKKKRTTMRKMANVVNEFLHSISKRRTDTDRTDGDNGESFVETSVGRETARAAE